MDADLTMMEILDIYQTTIAFMLLQFPENSTTNLSSVSTLNKSKLGQGGYGSVFLLQHKLNEEKVAAKFVDTTEYMKKADDIQKALKEAQYMLNLDHQNIVKLETVFLLK